MKFSEFAFGCGEENEALSVGDEWRWELGEISLGGSFLGSVRWDR